LVLVLFPLCRYLGPERSLRSPKGCAQGEVEGQTDDARAAVASRNAFCARRAGPLASTGALATNYNLVHLKAVTGV